MKWKASSPNNALQLTQQQQQQQQKQQQLNQQIHL